MMNDRIKAVVRTALEITAIVLTLVASFGGLTWFLSYHLRLSNAGVVMLVAPSVLLTTLAAIYGYSLGWRSHRRDQKSSLPAVMIRDALTVTAVGLMVLIITLWTLYALFTRRPI